MTKRERLEDLGIVHQKLEQIIDDIKDKYGRFIESKHAYEEFEEFLKKEHELYDLHVFLRFHLEYLCDIWAITKGDEE